METRVVYKTHLRTECGGGEMCTDNVDPEIETEIKLFINEMFNANHFR